MASQLAPSSATFTTILGLFTVQLPSILVTTRVVAAEILLVIVVTPPGGSVRTGWATPAIV